MGRKILKKPEVLAPAGTLEKLKQLFCTELMRFSLVGKRTDFVAVQGTSTLQK